MCHYSEIVSQYFGTQSHCFENVSHYFDTVSQYFETPCQCSDNAIIFFRLKKQADFHRNQRGTGRCCHPVPLWQLPLTNCVRVLPHNSGSADQRGTRKRRSQLRSASTSCKVAGLPPQIPPAGSCLHGNLDWTRIVLSSFSKRTRAPGCHWLDKVMAFDESLVALNGTQVSLSARTWARLALHVTSGCVKTCA